MSTITLNKYSIEDLNKKAFERAYYDWLEAWDYFWHEENMDSLNKFAEYFNLKINNLQYGGVESPYINYTIKNKFHRNDLDLFGKRLIGYLYKNCFDLLYKGKYYSKFDSKINYHSKVLFERTATLTGYCMDMELLDCFYEYLDNPNMYISLEGLIDIAVNNFIEACHKDYNHCSSREYFKEDMINTEVYFTSEGYRLDMVA